MQAALAVGEFLKPCAHKELVACSNSIDALHRNLQGKCTCGQVHSTLSCCCLQEATYDGADATSVSADLHPKLKLLRDGSADEAEYACLSRMLRRMLHPDLQRRATIDEVLASESFQDLMGGADTQ